MEKIDSVLAQIKTVEANCTIFYCILYHHTHSQKVKRKSDALKSSHEVVNISLIESQSLNVFFTFPCDQMESLPKYFFYILTIQQSSPEKSVVQLFGLRMKLAAFY